MTPLRRLRAAAALAAVAVALAITPAFAQENGENAPPAAVIDYRPSEPRVDRDVDFDASRSSDDTTHKNELAYAWDLDDDGTYDDAEGARTSALFEEPGQFRVSVAVADESGAVSFAAVVVTVTGNTAPTAIAGGDAIVSGLSVTLDGSGSTDPDRDTFTYAWDFGDGTTGSGATVTHTYARPGRHTVTLVVTDPFGASDRDTLRLTLVGPDGDDGADVARIGGVTRVETSVALSRWAFPTASNVVLARADAFPDALAAAPLAAELNAPILLTPPDLLHPEVESEIRRLGATTVYLAGGRAALTDTIPSRLRDLGVATRRVSGANRFDTARAIAAELVALGGPVERVIVALGDHPGVGRDAWPDALAAGTLATVARAPIVLTNPDDLPDESAAALGLALAPGGTVTVVGGASAVSAAVPSEVRALGYDVTRISGSDRFATATAVVAEAEPLAGTVEPLLLASGGSFADALAAAPAAWRRGGVMLLVHPTDLRSSAATRDWLRAHPDVERVRVAGGAAAVADAVLAQVAAAT